MTYKLIINIYLYFTLFIFISSKQTAQNKQKEDPYANMDSHLNICYITQYNINKFRIRSSVN